ncbi:MAG: glycosyltransferase [Lachnospiraceae bacterium]|nr:glycosyltransferase [Lachnospiraceae bacterium]
MSVIMNYYRHMDRSKIQFDFLCFIPCEDSYEDEIKELGGQVFFVSKPGSSWESLKELWKFFSDHGVKYQFLHNHEVYLSFLLKPLARFGGIQRFIVHCHATRFSDRKIAAFRNAVLCIPIRFMKCDRFACSKAAGDFLYGNRARLSGRVFVYPNAIEVDKYRFDSKKRDSIRGMLNVSPDTFLIGHVGRFVPQKNHRFLVALLENICETNADAHLLCIGEGPLKEEIEEISNRMDLDCKISFLGHRDDVKDLLNAFDVFVLPSLYEGFPVSLVEACYNGLPCVIADTISDEIEYKKVYRIPLEAPIGTWVNQINKLDGIEHDENVYIPEFDIYNQAAKLQEYYLKM